MPRAIVGQCETCKQEKKLWFKRICDACLRRSKYHADVDTSRMKRREYEKRRRDERVANGLPRGPVYLRPCETCGRMDKNAGNNRCRSCRHRERMQADHEYRVGYRRRSREATRRWKTAVDTLVNSTNNAAARRKKFGKLTVADILPLFTRDVLGTHAGTCSYCESIIVCGVNATIDHIDPNGPHAKKNIRLACRSCNSWKGDMPEAEFFVKMAEEQEVAEYNREKNRRALVGYFAAEVGLTLDDLIGLASQIRTS